MIELGEEYNEKLRGRKGKEKVERVGISGINIILRGFYWKMNLCGMNLVGIITYFVYR